jgi:hypothetical protein
VIILNVFSASIYFCRSSGFYYPAGTQAPGADLDIFYLTVLQGPNPPQVGQPTPFRFIIGVRNIITYLRPLAAHITKFSHGNRLLKFLK